MLLMEEAERIARDEHGSIKIAVISGILFVKCKKIVLKRDRECFVKGVRAHSVMFVPT